MGRDGTQLAPAHVHDLLGEVVPVERIDRTAAQQLLTDLQAFQAARNAATVPGTLSNSDGMLGDSISAGIAASQEFITGMDNNDATKITDGLTKLDAGMLAMAKAETALGAAIQ